MNINSNQSYRLNRLIEDQKHYANKENSLGSLVLKIEQITDTIFLLTYNDTEKSTMPFIVNKLGVLKTFPYNQLYHMEYKSKLIEPTV